MYTLKNYLSKFEHCIEFAKSKFSEIFEEYINDLNLIFKDFEKFYSIIITNINEHDQTI